MRVRIAARGMVTQDHASESASHRVIAFTCPLTRLYRQQTYSALPTLLHRHQGMGCL